MRVIGEKFTSIERNLPVMSEGRVCLEPTCETHLSRYNDQEYCSLHADGRAADARQNPRLRRAGRRNSADEHGVGHPAVSSCPLAPSCGLDGCATYTADMLLGLVWHFWIAPVLVGACVLAVLASVVGYLQQVTYKRYPRD